MFHYEVRSDSDDHYAVSSNEEWILLQLGNKDTQVRIRLSTVEAHHLIILLQEEIKKKLS